MLFRLESPKSLSHAVSEQDVNSPVEEELNDEFDAYIGNSGSSLSKSPPKLKAVPLPGKGGASLGLELKEMPPVTPLEQ